MYFRELAYDGAIRVALPFLKVARPFSPKLNRGMSGWRWAAAILEEWAAESRNPERPLVWLHAPSVGEALMAQAIIGELRRKRPELQVAFTHFSPSAERLAQDLGADVACFLPLDMGQYVRRSLAALQPAVVAYVRTEIWPVLTREARQAGVGVVMVNAVLSDASRRLRGPGPWFMAPAYSRLNCLGATNADDAERYVRLGVPADRIRVTGDARFDQVWNRIRGAGFGDLAAPGSDVPAPGSGECGRLVDLLTGDHVVTVVAGSTWPGDQSALIPAFRQLRSRSRCRLIVAPHEPTDRNLRVLEGDLRRAGLSFSRLGAVEQGVESLPDVVVVDRVGVLADLYAAGDITYVGGGFRSAGLHSVIEPAALAKLVLFGPRPGNSREALELEAAGGGFRISHGGDLAELLWRLSRDGESRSAAGAAAVRYVRSRLGGAEANAGLILEFLEHGHPGGLDQG